MLVTNGSLGVVREVYVDAERCAGHHIHTVRTEETEQVQTTKRETYSKYTYSYTLSD